MSKFAVVVPGIAGSRLSLNGQLIWPPKDPLLPYSDKQMQALLRDDLVCTGSIMKAFLIDLPIVPEYVRLFNMLAQWGFTTVDAGYDWRKDNSLSAGVLANCIDAAVQVDPNPPAEVHIIAHSMGGLVARYYLESGNFNGRPGFNAVHQLIMLATPHRGAARALPIILGREQWVVLSPSQVKKLANDQRYPSAYQLLPPPDEPFVWNGSPGYDYAKIDIYDPNIVANLGLVRNNLDAAKNFYSRLNRCIRSPNYFCFAGTQQTTATHAIVPNLSAAAWNPDVIDAVDGGDGTVPTWSSFLVGVRRMFVGGEHSSIYTNKDLLDGMANLLGVKTIRLAARSFEVILRDRVIKSGAQVPLSITFRKSRKFSGALRVERTLLDSKGKIKRYEKAVLIMTISYNVFTAKRMSLMFKAPSTAGLYRVALYIGRRATPVAQDKLVVMPKFKRLQNPRTLLSTQKRKRKVNRWK
jgi:phospholipase A1